MFIKLSFFSLIIFILCIKTASAYIGLAPLIPIIGNVIFFIFIGALAVIGLLLYPIKKIIEKRNKKNKSNLDQK